MMMMVVMMMMMMMMIILSLILNRIRRKDADAVTRVTQIADLLRTEN